MDLHCYETLQHTPPRVQSAPPLVGATPGKFVLVTGTNLVDVDVYSAALDIFLSDICTALGESPPLLIDDATKDWAYSIVMSSLH